MLKVWNGSSISIKFVKYDQNNEAVFAKPVFRSTTETCTNASDIDRQMAEKLQHLHNSYQNFERDGIDCLLTVSLNWKLIQ